MGGGAIIKSILFPTGIPRFVSGAINTRREARRVMEGALRILVYGFTHRKRTDSQREVAKCIAARGELTRIEEGIGHMAGRIDELADWWVKVEAMLDKVSENVGRIQANKRNRIQLGRMSSDWGDVRSKYLEYQTEVSQV